MQSLAFFGSGRRRAALGAVAALVIVLSLLALPPVRAAADNLLSVFRVQKVVFVPIDQARLQQLGALKLDKGALFVGEPATSNRQPPRTVGSAAEAAAAIGQPLLQPANLPAAPSSTTFTVNNGGQASFQINLDTARTVLDALDIRDVTLPDALGTAPITVDVPIFASTRYQGASYELTLHQSASPNVTLPDGVDMAQLGKATLRVLGMSPEQAEVVSSQINWNNTLLFPFPTDANNIRQVNVASDTGLLVTGGERNHQRGMLYWQHNGIMYMLEGRSDGANDEMIADMLLNAAESLQ